MILFVPAPEACHIIVEELVDALHAKRAKLHRKLTPDEATTVLERACVTVRSEYGLQMRNNAVTPVYSKHQAVARAEGNWISIFLINVCAQVVGEHEKAIVRGAFDAATSVNDLRARACQRGDAEEEEEEDKTGGAGLGCAQRTWTGAGSTRTMTAGARRVYRRNRRMGRNCERAGWADAAREVSSAKPRLSHANASGHRRPPRFVRPTRLEGALIGG